MSEIDYRLKYTRDKCLSRWRRCSLKKGARFNDMFEEIVGQLCPNITPLQRDNLEEFSRNLVRRVINPGAEQKVLCLVGPNFYFKRIYFKSIVSASKKDLNLGKDVSNIHKPYWEMASLYSKEVIFLGIDFFEQSPRIKNRLFRDLSKSEDRYLDTDTAQWRDRFTITSKDENSITGKLERWKSGSGQYNAPIEYTFDYKTCSRLFSSVMTTKDSDALYDCPEWMVSIPVREFRDGDSSYTSLRRLAPKMWASLYHEESSK